MMESNSEENKPQQWKPPTWEKDEVATSCRNCSTHFGMITRKHHCRSCGKIFCNDCCSAVTFPPQYGLSKDLHRCCYSCLQTFQKQVLMVGDSLTEGLVSADIAAILRKKFPGVRFNNAGVGGNTTYGLLKQLSDKKVLNPHRPPDVIISMIGGCNALSSTNESFRSFSSILYPVPPEWKQAPFTLESFLGSYKACLDIFKKNAPNARILILSIPPAGEDTDSDLNQLFRNYNDALRELLQTNFPDIIFAPLNDVLTTTLREHYQQEGQKPPPPVQLKMMDIVLNSDKALLYRYLLNRPMQEISDANGLYLTHDGGHFNERGGAIVAGVMEENLKRILDENGMEDVATVQIENNEEGELLKNYIVF
jgi:lysophospholipase L1-like esterase